METICYYISNIMNDILAKAIKDYQTRKGLESYQFAEIIDHDPSTLSRVKNGRRLPTMRFLLALMRIPELRPAVISYMEGE